MSWTTPEDLKAQVNKLWNRGLLLTSLSGGETIFPRRLTLIGPDSKELSERFQEVRDWIAGLSNAAGDYRIEWHRFNHRILGSNVIPSKIWIDSLDDALHFITKQRAAKQFKALVRLTSETQPELLEWLTKKPLSALKIAAEWRQLLSIIEWIKKHPRPAIYLRQIDLPGVHTKLIEKHRGVLSELLELILPEKSIYQPAKGVRGFCRRYGFRDKPLRVRLRILDPNIRLLPLSPDQDIALTKETFSTLDIPISNVFITENEINFLTFPEQPDAIVIFGAGYGFENIAAAEWLKQKNIYYWGDIDTHGFAILNQLRGFFTKAESILMDEKTMLAYRSLWGVEATPETGELIRLTAEERSLYDKLRRNHWGNHIRLEQERIGFGFLTDFLNHQHKRTEHDQPPCNTVSAGNTSMKGEPYDEIGYNHC